MPTIRSTALESVAIEADVLANLTSTVKKFFPSLVEELAPAMTALNGLVDFKKTTTELSKLDNKIVSEAKALHFDELAPVILPVPEGFTGIVSDYQDTILAALEYVKKTSIEAVNDFYVELAAVVSNKNMKIGLRDTTAGTKELTKSRELEIEAVSAFFNKASNVSTQTYKTAVGQHANLPEIFKKEAQIKDKLEGVKPQELNKRVKDISHVMDTLIKHVEQGHVEQLSPEVVRNLAEGMYEIANQVEFVAVTYYRAMALLTSIEGIRASMIKRLGL